MEQTKESKDYIDYGFAVSTMYREITKEEYTRLSGMTRQEVEDELSEKLSKAITHGYGYYGYVLKEKDGAYFIGIKVGNSCD